MSRIEKAVDDIRDFLIEYSLTNPEITTGEVIAALELIKFQTMYSEEHYNHMPKPDC